MADTFSKKKRSGIMSKIRSSGTKPAAAEAAAYLYGLSREEADYVLGTFPIVKREDEARFDRYRTRDLVLAYIAAYAAGNLDAWVKG